MLNAVMLLLLVALVCMVQTARAQCLTMRDDQNKNPAAYMALVNSRMDFSMKLLKAISNKNPSDNIFFSPLSVYNALLLAYFTSGGHTERSLKEALFLPRDQNKVNLLVSYRLQRHLLKFGAYKSQVKSSNRLFLSHNQTVKDCMSDVFEEEIQQLDFSRKGLHKAVDDINAWVKNVTNNTIQNLVSADTINPGTQLILANAAYFKGEWKTQFDEADTRNWDFYVNENKTVKVPMMFQENTFNHWRSQELQAEVLDLPYKGDEISLIIILPNPSNSSHSSIDVINRLNSTILKNLIRDSEEEKYEDKVELRLPKFTVEMMVELTPILEDMGVGDLFRSTSDLTGLTGGPRIKLNTAIHKAKIQVDEYGTVAAAATSLTDTRIPGNEFFCDRPFIYLLCDRRRTSLLFAGIYNDPTK